MLLDLDAERVTLRVWDLNTGEERTLDAAGDGALDLGTTDHDFAVLWDVR